MNTLFDKIWDAHVVSLIEDGPTQLYIDRLYCHEVTSPQAFDGLRARGIKCLRPQQIFCMPDHNTPTHDQDKPIEDPVSKTQVDALARNAAEFGLTHYGMMSPDNGIIHVVGPEKGLSLPGMTIVCGDSHTSTHGAVGAVAFGIGTSEVEMVLASQCILQQKPKSMSIRIEGELGPGVTAKDVALYLMMKLTTSGATGYFVEYRGSAVRSLSMEGRLTLCNLSIEMGARGGFVAPDETTFAYLKGREYAPKGTDWDKAVAAWSELRSGEDAVFDREVVFDAADIQPMITYGRLHQRPHRGLPRLRLAGERPPESPRGDRLAGARLLGREAPDRGGGPGQGARRGGLRGPAARLLGLPGDERRQDPGREVCRQYQQPQFRGPSGPGFPHAARESADRGRRCRDGCRN